MKKVFYICGTHWDREWYEPFQEYRFWLVQTLDTLLDRMNADARLAVYHLDCQAVLLEDYLEIRPERASTLREFLHQGRLVAGPWYAMPDLWLVSGEALIRNLSRGIRVVRELGGHPAPIGYAPDLFGHIAAMPMIYRGFGFIGAVVWRGLNDDQVQSQFLWEGADGSQIPTHKLPDNAGYPWFAHRVRWPWANAQYDPNVLIEKARCVLREEEKRSAVPLFYLSDTGDHQDLPERIPEMLDTLRAAFPDAEIAMEALPRYFEALATYQGSLKRFAGELRFPSRQTGTPWHALIPHCLSSRYPLKLANDRCQNLLTLWAEPMAALSLMAGRPIPSGFLDQAWKSLLQNQPHDSICGCSVDATHEDMPYRFNQAARLGEAVCRQGMAHLSTPTASPGAVRNLVVWNSLPWERSGVVELELLFPPDYPAKAMRSGHGFPVLNQFELRDAEGRALPYQILEVLPSRTVKQPDDQGRIRRVDGKQDVYRVAVWMDLPACGCTGITVSPLEGVGRIRRVAGSLRTAPLTATNEFLSLTVLPDGTVSLEHRQSGRVFRDLFHYEDSGDAGDGWNYVPPVRNWIAITPGQIVSTGVVEEGPLQVTFRIERILRIPLALEPAHRETRHSAVAEMSLCDDLTLRKGDPSLQVRTVVENTARDHRLRVLFPSDIRADVYESDQPFGWVTRPVATDPRSSEYKEPDPEERPHHTVFAIADTSGGLAVICPEGLHEHGVAEDARRTLALTLFRAVHRTPTTDGELGAQVLGRMEFRYWLRPFAGPLPRALLLREVVTHQAGIRTHLTSRPMERKPFFRLERCEGVLLTAFKPAEDNRGVVVRLWNTESQERSAILRFARGPEDAMRCDLNEVPQQSLPVNAEGVTVTVGARSLATIKLHFPSESKLNPEMEPWQS